LLLLDSSHQGSCEASTTLTLRVHETRKNGKKQGKAKGRVRHWRWQVGSAHVERPDGEAELVPFAVGWITLVDSTIALY
jgi:hypothetical protein